MPRFVSLTRKQRTRSSSVRRYLYAQSTQWMINATYVQQSSLRPRHLYIVTASKKSNKLGRLHFFLYTIFGSGIDMTKIVGVDHALIIYIPLIHYKIAFIFICLF
jgi:hypothetical protein